MSTYNRYLSALLASDRSSARVQREDAVQKMAKLRALSASEEEHYLAALEQVRCVRRGSAAGINAGLAIIKRKGFTPEQRKLLEARGLKDSALTVLRRRLGRLTSDALFDAMEKGLEMSHDAALASDEVSEKTVSSIARISSLKSNDRCRELRMVGLVSREELERSLRRPAKDSTYLLEELQVVGGAHLGSLASAGIATTADLLAQADTRAKRKRLSRTTGIGSDQILRLTNYADLVRVPGLRQEYARVLESIGVDTVVELGERKPDALYKALREASVKAQVGIRAPTEEQVSGWIAQARRLERRLHY